MSQTTTIDQIKRTGARASKALDASLAFAAESQKRIERMEAARSRKKNT
jgi:hypothetical protein